MYSTCNGNSCILSCMRTLGTYHLPPFIHYNNTRIYTVTLLSIVHVYWSVQTQQLHTGKDEFLLLSTKNINPTHQGFIPREALEFPFSPLPQPQFPPPPEILIFSMVFGQTWHDNINIITNINNININIIILTLQQTSSPPAKTCMKPCYHRHACPICTMYQQYIKCLD